MKGFYKGLIVGGTVVAAALMGYAYGTEGERDRVRGELESSCQVEVGLGSPTFSSQCRNDQVMIGVDQGYIYCAEVSVDCQD